MFSPISQIVTALRSMSQEVFDAAIDQFMRQVPTTIDQMNTLGYQTDQNRIAAGDSATLAATKATAAAASAADATSAAAAATVAANVTKWVSGTNYADGTVVWSPITGYPYRRIGAGSGTTDPSLDTAHYVLQLFVLGLGGTMLTGSATWTANSRGAFHVTPTEPGLYAVLADATTCLKSALQQSVYNAGEYDYGIRDAAGNVLGWVRPGTTVIVGLADNSTVAGVWMISGISKTGVTAQVSIPSLQSGGTIRRVTIDSARTMLVLPATTGIYAVVYDSSARTWTTTLVRTGSGNVSAGAVLSGPNQVLLVSTYGTDFEATTLTVSGTSVTPNTGGTAAVTLPYSSANIQSNPVAVGSSWVLPIYTGANWTIRAISVSGTSAYVGAEVDAISTFMEPRIFAVGSVARVISSTIGAVSCTPYTVSGTTLSPGTQATVSADTNGCRVTMNGNGNIVALYSAGTLRAAIFKLTGTTEAVTSAAADSAVYTGGSVGGFLGIEVGAISANKTVFYQPGDRVGIITDSGGTVSVGTNRAVGGGSTSRAFLGMSGTTARFALETPAGGSHLVQIDCSGTSPNVLGVAQTNLSLASPGPTQEDGSRSPFLLLAGAGATSAAHTIASSSAAARPQGLFSANRVRSNPALPIMPMYGVAGAASNESWFIGTLIGINIYHVEAAA
ncbi:hypothetical protein ACLB1G_21945 [Oxalobacteraceae bacterium A2-2]